MKNYMISVDKALRRILNNIRPIEKEEIDISSSLSRVLAQDLRAREDIPSFDNSAMDGFCLRSKDTRGASRNSPKIFRIIEDVPAGYVAKKRLKRGEAIRIMTGAPIPEGADCVIMVEETVEETKEIASPLLLRLRLAVGARNDTIAIFKEVRPDENIRHAGEDVKKGTLVIRKGTLIRPQEMGMLSAIGIKKIKVARQPKVAILATGDELIDVGEKLKKGKIRNSNGYLLRGQVLKCGGIALDLGIAKDRKGIIRNKIKSALRKKIDMLLVSAGISVGDYDVVKDVLAELGATFKFWKVRMRPGKPLAFGLIGGIPVFGLPGNPVSSAITFEEFVRPAILKMMAVRKINLPEITAVSMQGIEKKIGLRYFLRVKVENRNGKFYASLTGPQGSGILKSMVLADGIMVLPEDLSELKANHKARVQILDIPRY